MADIDVRREDMPAALLALKWLDRDGQCRLIVDDRLRIFWASLAARELLKRRADLESRDGCLATTNPSQQATLFAFVRNCGADLTSMCLPSEEAEAHILIRAHRLATGEKDGRCGLLFHRSGRDFTARYIDLDKVFQLTQAEHRVLLQLLNGSTADEVARALGVSIETTRSHIRHIYAKVNVTSREGLFSRVRPYQI